MTDTVKIPRPKFVRRKGGPTGRTEHDPRGNAVWVRTRASDEPGAPSVPELSLVDEAPSRGAASRHRPDWKSCVIFVPLCAGEANNPSPIISRIMSASIHTNSAVSTVCARHDAAG
jgi:hypothetical protein